MAAMICGQAARVRWAWAATLSGVDRSSNPGFVTRAVSATNRLTGSFKVLSHSYEMSASTARRPACSTCCVVIA